MIAVQSEDEDDVEFEDAFEELSEEIILPVTKPELREVSYVFGCLPGC